MDYEFHEAANIFPLDEEHLDELAADIRSQGLQKPIEIHEGKILDGRRRWLAGKKAGVHLDVVEVEPEDPVAYVISLNLHRRHLSKGEAGQCAARAAKLWEKLAGEARERQVESGKHHGRGKSGEEKVEVSRPQPMRSPQTRDRLGATFGVSGATVERSRRILHEGVPELVKAVEAGVISVNRGAEISKETPELQQAIVSAAVESGGKISRFKATPAPIEEAAQPEPRSSGAMAAAGDRHSSSRHPRDVEAASPSCQKCWRDWPAGWLSWPSTSRKRSRGSDYCRPRP